MKRLAMGCVLFVYPCLCLAQSPALHFDDVKLYYQKPGNKKFHDEDKCVLVLEGGQKVMLLLKENKLMFVARYDNVTEFSFDEKHHKTLTVRYMGAPGPDGLARLELPGKWKNILETLRNQSGKTVVEEKK